MRTRMSGGVRVGRAILPATRLDAGSSPAIKIQANNAGDQDGDKRQNQAPANLRCVAHSFRHVDYRSVWFRRGAMGYYLCRPLASQKTPATLEDDPRDWG